MNTWGHECLACPACKGALSADLSCRQCGSAGRWDNGIACFNVSTGDPSIMWYNAKGGGDFRERVKLPFTMSSLDTYVYHQYLAELKPAAVNALIVDIGAGDGRNSEPWLKWGYKRVIAADAVYASLARFRDYLMKEMPQSMEHILLVQCDARQLPLHNGIARVLTAIEALYYLNDDYERGLAECRRVLNPEGRLLISEPARESTCLTPLLYGGVAEMLKAASQPACYQKAADNSVLCSRNFTEEELFVVVQEAGLAVMEQKGISLLSMILGYLRGEGKLKPADQELFPDVCKLLKNMGKIPGIRRTHVFIAKPAA